MLRCNATPALPPSARDSHFVSLHYLPRHATSALRSYRLTPFPGAHPSVFTPRGKSEVDVITFGISFVFLLVLSGGRDVGIAVGSLRSE